MCVLCRTYVWNNEVNKAQVHYIYKACSCTHMPERKNPTVAIVAVHERNKTVDDILNESLRRRVLLSCGAELCCMDCCMNIDLIDLNIKLPEPTQWRDAVCCSLAAV